MITPEELSDIEARLKEVSINPRSLLAEMPRLVVEVKRLKADLKCWHEQEQQRASCCWKNEKDAKAYQERALVAERDYENLSGETEEWRAKAANERASGLMTAQECEALRAQLAEAQRQADKYAGIKSSYESLFKDQEAKLAVAVEGLESIAMQGIPDMAEPTYWQGRDADATVAEDTKIARAALARIRGDK